MDLSAVISNVDDDLMKRLALLLQSSRFLPLRFLVEKIPTVNRFSSKNINLKKSILTERRFTSLGTELL